MRMPRVIIFVRESYNNKIDAGSSGVVYSELASKFSEKRFVVVSRPPVADPAEESLFNLLKDSSKLVSTACSLGQKYEAEIVVVASGESQIASVQPEILANSSMKSYQAGITLQVINVSDKRVLASVSKNSAAAHIDADTGCRLALKKATGPAADEAITLLLAAWEDILNNGNLLTLNVTGLSIAEGFQFQKALEKYLREVKEVFPKKNENGSAQFTVRYLGDGRDFVMALSTVDMGFKIDVEAFDSSTVKIKAVKK